MAFGVRGWYLIVQVSQGSFRLYCDGPCMINQNGSLWTYSLPFTPPTEHLLCVNHGAKKCIDLFNTGNNSKASNNINPSKSRHLKLNKIK